MGTNRLFPFLMAALLLAAVLTVGCATAPGRIYTNITRPVSTDFNNTPTGSKKAVIEEHSVKEPITGYGISVEWSSYQINSAARKAGITKIAFIEEQIKSYLFGLYSHKSLIIYGD